MLRHKVVRKRKQKENKQKKTKIITTLLPNDIKNTRKFQLYKLVNYS